MQNSIWKRTNANNIIPLALLGAILLGAFVRLYPALTSDFPINDGGLFYRFILELQKQAYRLPAASTYNQAQIPYVYPPLSFYLAGLTSSILQVPLLDIIRWLPAFVSVSTIPAFYFMAREILKSKFQAILAVYCFAFLPTAFDFMVVGGGLSRSFGFLFSILTLQQEFRMLRSNRFVNVFGTGIFAALTVMSHPVAAWFTFFSAALIWFFVGRSRQGITQAAAVILIGAAISAPWWGTVLLRFGPQVLFSAFQAGQLNNYNVLAVFLFIHTNEPLLDLEAALALFGFFACLKNKQFFVPVWLVAVFLLEPRLSATYAVMPTALLAASGLDSIGQVVFSVNSKDENTGVSPRNYIGRLLFVYLFTYGLIAAFISTPHNHLTPAERQAMSWVQSNIPQGQSFLVLSGIHGAGDDYVSEWFPAVTDQISLATPQGSEWLPGDVFRQRWIEHDSLQACYNRDGTCLDQWAEHIQSPYQYVLITPNEKGEIGSLPAFLEHDKNFEIVYQRDGVEIYRHNPSDKG
jgi:hypothetical protein